jgi:hypothetical protein
MYHEAAINRSNLAYPSTHRRIVGRRLRLIKFPSRILAGQQLVGANRATPGHGEAFFGGEFALAKSGLSGWDCGTEGERIL